MKAITLDAIEAAACGCTVPAFEALAEDTTPEIAAMETRLAQLIRGAGVFDACADENAPVTQYGTACQSLGFRNGFKLGVRLMAECLTE